MNAIVNIGTEAGQAVIISKRDLTRRMFTAMGGAADMGNMISQMAEGFSGAITNERQRQLIMDAITADSAILMERMCNSLGEILTLDELAGLVAFYESPLGAALVMKMPQFISVGQQIGAEWASELYANLEAQGLL